VFSILRSVKRVTPQDCFIHYGAECRSLPLYQEIGLFLYPSTAVMRSSLVFGLHLLSETAKSYLEATPSAPNLRLRVLAFAQEIKAAVEETKNLGKEDMFKTLFHSDVLAELNALGMMLQDFTKQKSFDMYHQSPWVAGSFVPGFLAHAQRFGLRLLNQRGAFGSVLHL
jgi:hypothetical protein